MRTAGLAVCAGSFISLTRVARYVGVMDVMTSPAYHGYAGTHLPIAEQEVGLQEVELCI